MSDRRGQGGRGEEMKVEWKKKRKEGSSRAEDGRKEAAREEGRVDMKQRRGSEGKEAGEKTDLITDWR